MISRKFSAEKFSFSQTLKKHIWLPVLAAVLLSILFAGNGYWFDKDPGVNFAYYIFSDIEMSFYSLFVQLFSAAASALLAVLTFSFITSKPSVNVFFSMGITRKNLFLTRYAAGVLMIFVFEFIPFALQFAGNGYTFGYSSLFLTATLYHFIGLLISSIYTFTVTALVFCCVGSVAEGLIYSAIMLFAPVIINYSFGSIIPLFIYGSAFNIYFSFYNLNGELSQEMIFPFHKIEKYYNPLMLGCNATDAGNLSLPAEQSAYFEKNEAFVFAPYIIWIAATVALLLLSVYIFKNRKAEKAGFTGACKPLTAISAFIISLGVFSFVSSGFNSEAVVTDSLRIAAFVIGLIFIVLLFFAVQLIIFRSFRQIRKNIKYLLVQVGAFAVIGIVLFTGGLGIEKRIPDADEIKSVGISTGSSDILLLKDNVYDIYYNNSGDEIYQSLVVPQSYENYVINGFTDKNHIELVRSVHKKLIEMKNFIPDYSAPREEQPGEEILICYNLKNGKKIMRSYYNSTISLCKEINSLTGSDEYRQLLSQSILKNSGSFESRGAFIVGSAIHSYTEIDNLKLQKLLNCVSEDIKNKNMPLPVSNSVKPIGFILIGDEAMSFYSSLPEIAADDFRPSMLKLCDTGIYSVPIYPSMSLTIDNLKQNSLYGELEKKPAAVKTRLFETAKANSEWAIYSKSFEICGCNVTDGDEYFNAINSLFDSEANYVFDGDCGIFDVLTVYGVNTEDGYYAEVTLDDGSITIGYVSKSDAGKLNSK